MSALKPMGGATMSSVTISSTGSAQPALATLFSRVAASLAVIVLVALGLRIGFMFYQQRQIPEERLRVVPFQYEAGNIARSLAEGKGFSSPFRVETGPTAWLTPVYPLIIAGIFKIFGVDTFQAFEASVLLNIFFSTLTCVPIYFAGKRIAGPGVAATAAWLWAIFPSAIIIPFEWIWDTSLSALLAATILWATLRTAESQRVRDWCAYGLLWGFALMTNPTLGSLLPFLLAWMAWRARKVKRNWLSNAALALGIAAVCCVPWTIRNFETFHRWVPLRSTLGLQLWLGNNPYFIHSWPAWLHPIDNLAERTQYIEMGEISYMNDKLHQGLHYMLAFPKHDAKLCWDRFVATWLGSPHPFADTLQTHSQLLRVVNISNFLATLGTLAGIFVLLRRRSPFAFPVIAFPVIFPCVYYLTIAFLRYRHPIDPIVLLLCAMALDSLRGSRPRFQVSH
jgi:4-amino-4-deoxy-L-arabinose transferase-like glycosyltransferase